MSFFDLPLDELKTYLPPREEPADFDSFWKSTFDEARAFPLNAKFERVDYGLVAQETSTSPSQALADNRSKAG
jgi:cephalosporin-C deacetylase